MEAISAQEEGKLREEKLGGTRVLEGNQLNFLRLKFKVIRRVTRLRGICLESVFVNQPMCLSWRFWICEVIMAM
ncbi:unnamed protein product [Camellia sinensis]